MSEATKPALLLPDDSAGLEAVASVLAAIEGGRARLDPRGIARLLELLAHPQRLLRRSAAGALAAVIEDGDIATGEVEALLFGPSAEQRWGAAFALSRNGIASAAVLEAALDAFSIDDGDVRWAASAIVSRAARQSPELRRKLQVLTASPKAVVRKMALLSLCDGGEKDERYYIAALGDADSFVRLAALTSLGRIGARSEAALAAIRRSADSDVEQPVQRAAAAILRRLGGAACD